MKISILMAVKNEQHYVQEAVDSILQQVGADFELIVVDDNSTDNTYAIIEKLRTNEQRMKFSKSPGVGKNAAFNLAFQLSSGDAICLFAGDDIMPKDSLRERCEALNNEAVGAIILSKMRTISDNSGMHNIVIPKGSGKASTSGASPLIPRDICYKIFPIPESLPNEDTWIDLYFTYFFSENLVHTNIICCDWRIHSGNSISHTQSFEKYSEAYAKRARAILIFAELNLMKLEDHHVTNVCSRILLEQYRLQRRWLSILMTRAAMIDRLRALVNSSKFLYSVRQRLYRFTTGW